MLIILNSCIGSSLTSNGIPFIVKEFGVKSQPQRVLPISVYLIGTQVLCDLIRTDSEEGYVFGELEIFCHLLAPP